MDEAKLNRLRELYAEADGAEYLTERFRHVGEKLADRPINVTKPFAGIPTFLDLPYCESLDDLDVAIIGIPMDLGVTNRSGARFGPRAVRTIERVGPYSHVLDEVPRAVFRAADVGDVPMRSRFSLSQSLEDIEAYYRKVVAAGVVPLSVGGDHSVTYPILKAIGEKKPVGMVHIDAHMDTGGAVEGEKFHHGGPFRQAVLSGVLDPDRCVQIGIRGSSEINGEFSYESGMTVIHAEDVERQGVDSIIATAKSVVGEEPFYITIDVDGIDPAYTPGTGTPEVGGLTPLQVQMMLRELAGMNIVGGDVVEVAPQYDATTNTAHVAAQLLFELFALLAVSR
jgi:guanidinopropionase